MTLGIPRLKEIINVCKKPKTPAMSLRLLLGEGETAESNLKHMTLSEFVREAALWYQTDCTGSTDGAFDHAMLRSYWEFPDDPKIVPTTLSPWMLRVVLLKDQMHKHGQSMFRLAQKLKRNVQGKDAICVMYSDDNADTLVMHVRTCVGEDCSAARLQSCMHQLSSIPDTAVSGVSEIDRVIEDRNERMRYDPVMGLTSQPDDAQSASTSTPQRVVCVDTEGSNLLGVMRLPCVDSASVKSNDILEVMNVLGIEAARNMLVEELLTVVQFDGSYINLRHVELLADVMVHRGQLMAITRHGINRQDTGTLMRCSFEETVDIFLDAAVYNERDALKGVTENIMAGRMADFGTGNTSVGVDVGLLETVRHTLKRCAEVAIDPADEDDDQDDMPDFMDDDDEVVGGETTHGGNSKRPPTLQNHFLQAGGEGKGTTGEIDHFQSSSHHTITSPRYHEEKRRRLNGGGGADDQRECC